MGDMIADSIVVLVLELTRNPTAVQALTAQLDTNYNFAESRLWAVWTNYLKQNYGETAGVLDEEAKSINFEVDGTAVVVDFPNRKVEVDDPLVMKEVMQSLQRVEDALQPVPKF